MTVGEWEHLVRDVLPRVEAEQQLKASMAASVPHMTQDGREQLIHSWQQTAATIVRTVVASIAQVQRLRRFFQQAGINPETGQSDPKFRPE
jgi:lauroyl/myristoyl acyltransferase